jgi:integrase
MAHRRVNGEGTTYRRKDGRYEAAAYLLTTGGGRKRIRVYGKTWQEAHDKLAAETAMAQAGVPVPDRHVKLGAYLDYWLEQFVKINLRPKTYEQYEIAVRLYLKPGLGARPISGLSVPMVQTFLTGLLAEGHSVRKVQIVRTTLSAALTCAGREELLIRNVARQVKLPAWERAEIQPWSVDEATRFLKAAEGHLLYPAFVLLLFYGIRRGEVLGLRWRDIDRTQDVMHIRQQLQRIGRTLTLGPVKTKAGQRDLPLLGSVGKALLVHQQRQAAVRTDLATWAGSGDDQELVFTTSVGTPIEPRNFVRSFWGICNAHGIRVIKLHHLRHTTATLLKDLGVPARDAQLILGHASPWMTEQIYQHDDMTSRTGALTKIESLFTHALESESERCRQDSRQKTSVVEIITSVLSGGPGGTRTLDTLLKSSIEDGVYARATEVNRVMNERRRCWVVGVVAVNVAVKIEQFY